MIFVSIYLLIGRKSVSIFNWKSVETGQTPVGIVMFTDTGGWAEFADEAIREITLHVAETFGLKSQREQTARNNISSFLQIHFSNRCTRNPSSNAPIMLLNLICVCPRSRLENNRGRMKGVWLSNPFEKRIGGYRQGKKSSLDISSPSQQVHISVSAAEGSRFPTWNRRSTGKLLVALLIQLTYSLELPEKLNMTRTRGEARPN